MKPAKLVSSKTLSSPAGVADVSFGGSTPERRMQRDHSKSGMDCSEPDYDDRKEREDRWRKIATGL